MKKPIRKGIKKNYTAWDSDYYENNPSILFEEGEREKYVNELREKEKGISELCRNAVRELSEYISIRYSWADQTDIGAEYEIDEDGDKFSDASFMADFEGDSGFVYSSIEDGTYARNLFVTVYTWGEDDLNIEIASNEFEPTRRFDNIREAEDYIDRVADTFSRGNGYYASARKGVRKGIKKLYAQTQSEIYEGFEEQARENKHYADAKRYHSHAYWYGADEAQVPDLMGYAHEIADYISIRYANWHGEIKAYTERTYEDVVKVRFNPIADYGGEYSYADNVTGWAFKSITVWIKTVDGQPIYDIEAESEGDNTYKKTAYSKEQAYGLIDECMRALEPSFFASTRKNMKKSRKPIRKSRDELEELADYIRSNHSEFNIGSFSNDRDDGLGGFTAECSTGSIHVGESGYGGYMVRANLDGHDGSSAFDAYMPSDINQTKMNIDSAVSFIHTGEYHGDMFKSVRKSRKPIRKEIHDIMDTDLVAVDANTAMAYFSNGKETRGQTISIADGDSFEHLYSDFVDNGRSFDGWEDGIGNPVAWDIAEPIEPSTNGWRFVSKSVSESVKKYSPILGKSFTEQVNQIRNTQRY